MGPVLAAGSDGRRGEGAGVLQGWEVNGGAGSGQAGLLGTRAGTAGDGETLLRGYHHDSEAASHRGGPVCHPRGLSCRAGTCTRGVGF